MPIFLLLKYNYYQKYLKDYIDDLVFILYFNISIDKNIIDNPEKIREICSKNEYYSLIQDRSES